MKRRALCICLLLAPAIAPADRVVLDGGEILSGRLIRITEGALIFRTTLSGQMMAPMDSLRALGTDHNFMVTTAEDQVYYGRFVTRDNKTHFKTLDGRIIADLALAAVKEAEKLPETAHARIPPENRVRSYSGIQRREGGRDSTSLYAGVEVARRGPDIETTAAAAIERSDPEYFPAWFEAAFRISPAEETGRLAPEAGAAAERDTNAALDLRTDFNLGVRYRFENGAEALAGLNLAMERWDNTDLHLRESGYPGRRERADRRDLNLRLGLRYVRLLAGGWEISETMQLFPGLSHAGRLRAQSDTALTVPLSARLRLRLNLQLDYENAPALSHLDSWRGAFGAGIQFEF
jgi:hypothetical protein